VKHLQVFHPREGFWPHPQILELAEMLARDKHSSLLQKFVN
jgi:hypothetical protein